MLQEMKISKMLIESYILHSFIGEISGWIEVDVTFQENPDLYSNSHPRPYPPRPAEDFDVELIQLHIARITSLIRDPSYKTNC